MTNGTYQVQPMAETPRSTSSSLTMFIDDDPTLPRLTMTNGILVPVIDGSEKKMETGSVPYQYYTVTSFCQNPKHMGLNYAKQQNFHWNNASPTCSSSIPNKATPREIIHKIHYEEENPESTSNEECKNEINAQRNTNGHINHGISFIRNNRACSVVNLTLAPVRNVKNGQFVNAREIPSRKVSMTDIVLPDLRTLRDSVEPSLSPTPIVRYIPIAPPRNRNSNFRSSSQSKENLEFQTTPLPGGTSGGRFATELIDLNDELLASQFDKKEKLRLAVQSKQMELAQLKREVQILQKKLEPLLHIEKLLKDNTRLQHQCNLLTSEVDYYTNGSIPLGETSAEFYRERSPRQDPNASFPSPATSSTSGGQPSSTGSNRSPMGRLPTGSHYLPTPTSRKIPPPRPPPPNSLCVPWDCTKCTFRNHPDLRLCEQCDMIRVITSSNSSPSGSQGPSTPSPPNYYPQQPRSAS